MRKLNILAASIAMSFGVSAAELPANLEWQTNTSDPVFASSEAKRGGTLRTHLQSFPLTFRSVGPDSNSGLRSYFLDAVPSLTYRHPETLNYVPSLATEWAFSKDNKTAYFKLDPKARWNDGEKITADDYLFMLKFMRSKDIVAPWYNNFFNDTVAEITKYDDYTISVSISSEKNNQDLLDEIAWLAPRPAHFYANPKKDENGDGIHDDYVKVYNYKGEPTAGPYYVDKLSKGKSVTFKHVGDDWWGYTNKYYQNRYNVDKVRIKVIRNDEVARQSFEKGDLDVYALTLPEVWHEKTDGDAYQNGYIHKFWGYNQYPQGAGGFWLNLEAEGLQDINIRKGIAHATDMDGMIAKLIRGDYSRKPHAMGSGFGEYGLDNAKALEFDVNKAVSYFEKAGFTKVGTDGIRVNEKGERLSFELAYLYKVWDQRVAYLNEQAKLAGLELSMKLIDGATGFKYMSEKKHEIAFVNMGTGAVPRYWQYWHSDNAIPKTNNFTMMNDPKMDTLIDQYKKEFDVTKKKALSRELMTLIQEKTVIVPSYTVPWTREGGWRWMKYPQNAMNKWTRAMFDIGRSVGYGTYWIDSDVKKETLDAVKEGKAFEPVTVIDDRYKS